ncbi:MAG: FG-GAP repeat protein, partial [Gammaproteobacteria bacterium]|nr:FG-GAP repeat protein [Gammaproteobacteria bacterium]
GETSQSTNVNINNSPPFVVNNSIALVSDGGNLSSVHVGDTLSVEFEFGDPDNDAQGSHLYQWYRGTNAIPAEYKISYQVKTSDNTLNLSVKITPAQLDGTQGETKTSPVVNVINRAPTIIGKPLIANTSSNDLNQTHVGDILTASYQFNDPDGDAEGASTGVWTRDGSEIPLSNEKSYTLKAADSGKNIAYLVKELRDIHGLSTQTAGVSVSVLVQNTAPHINSIVLAGSAELNTELTALVSFSDVDGDGAGSHLYQWKRNGANVGGKSLSNTYLVGALDVGTKISVEVTPQDDKGLYGEPVLSTAAAIFDFSNPAMFNLSITPNIKQLNISWDKIAIADYYRVLFKTDAGSGYSVAADELGTEKFSLNIATHKMDWTNASIIIEACGSNSCLSSNETMLNSLMISSIGYFKAFNSEEGDTFGWAVALSNDGKTMAVGAQFEDSAAKGINNTNPGWNDNSLLDSGAVYIYQRYVDTWLPQAYIKASNPGKDDKFGERLALSGDGNTLVVGAPLEDSNERGITAGSPEYGDFEANPDYNAGAVYVYRRTGNSWSQQAYLKGSNTDSLDFFGDAVSISYDGNTIAVGTFSEDSKFFGVDNLNTHPDQEDNSLDYSGAAYVFQFNNGAWAQQAYIKSSHPVNNDYFGRHLDISDDGNTLVVGATGEDTKSTGVISGESPELPSEIAGGSGAVFIFERDLGLWRQVAFVKASNTGGGDEFGSSVAISGDAKTLVVGAKGEDGGYKGVINGSEPQIPPDNLGVIFKTGAAYVYRKVADTWIHDAYLKASNTGKIDIYGYTVAISGDGNTVAVQGRQEDGNFHGVLWGDADPLVDGNQGAVYVYKRDSEWKQLSYVKAINVSPITFGDGLALDQDGSTMAVGSPGDRSAAKEINSTNPGPDDISAYSSGAVFLY